MRRNCQSLVVKIVLLLVILDLCRYFGLYIVLVVDPVIG